MGMSPSALTVTYAANGNMTTGLDGKVMAYDGENRPVSVSFAGRTTTYVYGADRARLKKVETDPLTGQSTVTLPICSSGGICVSRFRNTGASPMRLPVRGGSVDLNRFRAFSKWFSASVTPLPLLASAG